MKRRLVIHDPALHVANDCECHICHKKMTARGNRSFWIRGNHGSWTEIVCGRKACQETVREHIPDGFIYSYRTVLVDA